MVKTVAFARQSPVLDLQSSRYRRQTMRRTLPPASQKKQSTLTQIDFISTPMQHRYTIPESDDEEEFTDHRPTKRQRKSLPAGRKKAAAARSESQSTLTQKWDQPTLSGFVIEDSDTDIETESKCGMNKHAAKVTANASMQSPATHLHSLGNAEIEQERGSVVKSPLIGKSPNADAGYACSGKSTAAFTMRPSTPRRSRKEVPSSETPSSIKLSLSVSPRCREVFGESPLTERSMNTISRARRTTSPTPLRIKQKSTVSANSRTQVMAQRTTKTGSGPDEPSSSIPPSTPPKRAADLSLASLRRMATVQDSQEEVVEDSEDRSLLWDSVSQHSPDLTVKMKGHQFGNDNAQTQYQLTYDPVSAALDRDAARFAQRTQTQIFPYEPEAVSRNIEESGQQLLRELNAIYSAPSNSVVKVSPRRAKSTIPSSPDQRGSTPHFSPTVVRDVQSSHLEDASQIIAIPDSPTFVSSLNLPRLPQVDTTVSSPHDTTLHARPFYDVRRDALPDDPSSMAWQESLSSPIFQLPTSAGGEVGTHIAYPTKENETILTSDWTDSSLPRLPLDVTR